MTWIQEDRWDDDALCCRFRLSPDYRGQIKKLYGTWSFKPHPAGTEMIFDAVARISHPLLTPRLHRHVDSMLRRNNEALLKGVKKKAEAEKGG